MRRFILILIFFCCGVTLSPSGFAGGVRRYSAAAERGWTSPAPDSVPESGELLPDDTEVELDMDEYWYGHVRDS